MCYLRTSHYRMVIIDLRMATERFKLKYTPNTHKLEYKPKVKDKFYFSCLMLQFLFISNEDNCYLVIFCSTGQKLKKRPCQCNSSIYFLSKLLVRVVFTKD